MKTQLNKLMIIALTGMMLTTAPKKAEALIPLPSFDFSRISENVKKTINQVMEIKAEIDSNLMILREIQNGGFAAAAGMLFAKIENGDYDRLGGNITGLKESMEVNAAEAQGAVAARKECKKKADEVKKKMEDLYKKCEGENMSEEDAKKCMNDVKKQIKKAVDKERKMCELEMNKATGEKIAEIRRKNVEKAEKKAEEYKKKKGEVTFHNVYSWVQGANVSGAIGTAANGGSAGDIVKGFGSSAGAILGGAGDENAKLISGASSVIGGVSNTVGEGGSFQDTIVNGLNNGDIMGGFDQIQDGHDDYMAEQQRQQEEAARAAEEAARQAEENRRQQEEAARQLEEWQNTLRNGGAVDHSYRGQ